MNCGQVNGLLQYPACFCEEIMKPTDLQLNTGTHCVLNEVLSEYI